MTNENIQNEKAVLFERTSTKEQHPELQHNELVDFCNNKGIEIIGEFVEQASAFKKNVKRHEWERCVEFAKANKCSIVVFRYDRPFRNKEKFFEFMKVMFELFQIKVYSVKEPSILMLWEMIDKTSEIQDITMREFMKGQMKLLWEFLVRMAGESAQEESEKRSQRTKLAVVRKAGTPTLSYKGNKWGRKALSQNIINKVMELHKQGKSIREISALVKYNDKNNNCKHVSVAKVHGIISANKSPAES